jgi:hypothetical protein
VFSTASDWEVLSDLARFTARFSFRDLPDFFVMLERGDLSDMAGPSIWGPFWSRFLDATPLGRLTAADAAIVAP